MATSALRSNSHRSTFRFDDFFPEWLWSFLRRSLLVSRSYYLAVVFHAPLPNLLIHVHGAVFTSWIVLLITQTSLVAGGRTNLHRRLGLLGFAVACLMVILGVMVATDSTKEKLGKDMDSSSGASTKPLPEEGCILLLSLVWTPFASFRCVDWRISSLSRSRLFVRSPPLQVLTARTPP